MTGKLAGGRWFGMIGPAESFENAAGCRVRMLRGGTGAPLLFLHGKRGAGAWLPFFSMLAERFQVLVPEHPGFGRSETPEWLESISDIADFYRELLVRLRVGAVHLVGTSIGGWIAADLAAKDTSHVATVTLMSSAGIRVNGIGPEDPLDPAAGDIASRLFADRNIAARMLGSTPDEDERRRQAKNARTFERLCAARRLHDPELALRLRRIDRPTLIVWGEKDRIIPPEHGPALRALIPGSRLELLQDCGHLPHIEKAEETAALIGKFIEDAA